MSHVSNREIAAMSAEAREARLLELQEELLQLRAEKSLGVLQQALVLTRLQDVVLPD